MLTINERIRNLRKDQLHLNQTEFAELLGMKQTSVSSFEKQGATVTEQTIKSICREFNVNESWLRDGTGDIFVKLDRDAEIEKRLSEILSDSSDSFKKRFISMMLKLNEEEWQWIADKAYELIAERAPEDLPEPDPVADAEAAYIKSRSDSAQNTDSSASNTA